MNSFIYNELLKTCMRPYFIKQNSLEWFNIHRTLIMTWAVEEHCSEINVILIQHMSV